MLQPAWLGNLLPSASAPWTPAPHCKLFARSVRAPVFLGSKGQSTLSWNGAPEGDPLRVAIMCAIWGAVADQAAREAVKNDFEFLRDLTSELADRWRFQQDMHALWCKYLVDVFYKEAHLKAALRSATPVDETGGMEDASFADQLEAWQAITRPTIPSSIPSWEEDLILVCTWPPWFSTACGTGVVRCSGRKSRPTDGWLKLQPMWSSLPASL